MGMNDRFLRETPQLAYHAGCLPVVVALSTTVTSQAGAATKDVTGSSLKLRAEDFKPGTAFRITMAGTKSGGNAVMSAHISLGGTQVLSISDDDITAGDWMAIMVVASRTVATQIAFGQLQTDALDNATDTATGTVNMAGGGILKAQITSGNAGDTVTCEFCMIEMIRL